MDETRLARDVTSGRPQPGGRPAWCVPQDLGEALVLAEKMAGTGLVPKDYRGKPDDVLVAMQAGAEVGLSPMASLQSGSVINGRYSLWGDGAIAVVRAHPDCMGIEESLDEEAKVATCTVHRRGEQPITRTFSWADAERAGLAGKAGPWTLYPKRMLQMRARGFAVRDAFPDALRGIGIAEEQQDILVAAGEPLPPQVVLGGTGGQADALAEQLADAVDEEDIESAGADPREDEDPPESAGDQCEIPF